MDRKAKFVAVASPAKRRGRYEKRDHKTAVPLFRVATTAAGCAHAVADGK
jgi:hypothetical protein